MKACPPLQRGVTLVELMVGLSVLAILVGLGVPAFGSLIRSSVVSDATNGFLADMRFARSESVRRGMSVVVCRSDDPVATSPTCATAGGTNGWASGWIVFEDLDGDGNKDSGETVLRLQQPSSTIGAITEGGTGSTKFRYTSMGRLRSLSSTTKITFGYFPSLASGERSKAQRVVCVNVGGRARIAGNGTVSCET